VEPEIPQDDRDERASKPAALQLELPSAMPAREAASPVVVRETLPRRMRTGIAIAAGVVGLAVIAGVAVEVLVPRYVRRTCIEQAAAHGITLAIDDVTIETQGFVLHGVKATSPDFPGASLEGPDVKVTTEGLKPQKITASGMEIALSGRWSAVSAALDRWRASAQGGQEGAWAPASLVLDGSRIVWRGALAEHASFEAAGVHLDVAWSGREPTMHATSSNVTATVPGGSIGPWRVDLDREPGASRARVALDPAVPDACTVLVVGNDDAVTSVEVSVPRSPMARLGIPPALVGLHGNLQVEATAHYAPLSAQGTATASTKGGIYGVAVAGVPQPLDLAWDLSAAGQGGVVDIKNSRVAVGPLVGAARGTIRTYADGFRVDAAWSAGPVPCAALDTPLAPGQPFDIAYQIRKLAESAGLTSLRGDVAASATLVFDSRDLGSTTLAFTPKANCDVALGF
jgi:hypothetical protein